MSACVEFRDFLTGMAQSMKTTALEDLVEDPQVFDIEEGMLGEISRTFDEIHRKNQENTGDECKAKPTPRRRAEIRAGTTILSDELPNDARIVTKEGSVFYLKNTLLESWEDSEGGVWLFAFRRGCAPMIFDAGRLKEYRQLKAVEE